MHPALTITDHRPWPLPSGRWTWRQSWCDLLFAHWPVPAKQLRPLIPASLEVQEFDGTAWVGVIPFHMTGVMRRPWPDMPGLSAFAELNVRTYVERDGKPGVWFLSLDATNRLAVWAARRFFHLPYHLSDMQITPQGSGFDYRSHRKNSEQDASFVAHYRPTSDAFHAKSGTIDHWLTERYCLYAESPGGQLYRCDVHHVPWSLQQASVTIEQNTISAANNGIELTGEPTYTHFARRVDALVWPLERVG